MSFEKMYSQDYRQGYFHAVMDIYSILEDMQDDLKRHKRRQCWKTYKAILQLILKEHIVLREDLDAFIRCNDNANGGYELYHQNKRRR